MRTGRTPRGVRGLKYLESHRQAPCMQSHPARGAWIEIQLRVIRLFWKQSHPARGAWIEICYERGDVVVGKVAPREGCVD